MNSNAFQHLTLGLFLLITGLSGWLVPFAWRWRSRLRHVQPNASWWDASDLVGILLAIFGLVVLLRAAKLDGDVISNHKVVMIEFNMYDEIGKLLETSERQGPLTYLHGIGELPLGLENELEGKQAGDQVNVTLPPDDAYGQYDESLVQNVPRSQFEQAHNISIGVRYEAETEAGPRVVRVVGFEGNDVIVDANEPYAGYTVRFEVKVLSVRAASKEEVERGQVTD